MARRGGADMESGWGSGRLAGEALPGLIMMGRESTCSNFTSCLNVGVSLKGLTALTSTVSCISSLAGLSCCVGMGGYSSGTFTSRCCFSNSTFTLDGFASKRASVLLASFKQENVILRGEVASRTGFLLDHPTMVLWRSFGQVALLWISGHGTLGKPLLYGEPRVVALGINLFLSDDEFPLG